MRASLWTRFYTEPRMNVQTRFERIRSRATLGTIFAHFRSFFTEDISNERPVLRMGFRLADVTKSAGNLFRTDTRVSPSISQFCTLRFHIKNLMDSWPLVEVGLGTREIIRVFCEVRGLLRGADPERYPATGPPAGSRGRRRPFRRGVAGARHTRASIVGGHDRVATPRVIGVRHTRRAPSRIGAGHAIGFDRHSKEGEIVTDHPQKLFRDRGSGSFGGR